MSSSVLPSGAKPPDASLRPRVGIGVLIFRGNCVLLGRRRNAHGAGDWAPPGGHLEFGESPEACATREVREETGLQISTVRLGAVTNDIFPAEHKHYVTLFMIAEAPVGDAVILEPDKCEEWRWFEWRNLPAPLFLPLQHLLQQEFDPFRSPTSDTKD
jgi:8-oxo-dGTP diphosphatase